MKVVDKLILFIFSVIVLAIVVIIGMINFNLFNIIEISKRVIDILSNITADQEKSVLYILEAIFGILALKGIFFQAKTKKAQDGILLENNNGKLLISKTTLQNLVRDLALNVPGVLNATPKILLNKDTELITNIDVVVYKDAVIKDITKEIQEQVIESIKKASDLTVSAVNVNIQNISSKTYKSKGNVIEKEKEQKEVNAEKVHETKAIKKEEKEIKK